MERIDKLVPQKAIGSFRMDWLFASGLAEPAAAQVGIVSITELNNPMCAPGISCPSRIHAVVAIQMWQFMIFKVITFNFVSTDIRTRFERLLVFSVGKTIGVIGKWCKTREGADMLGDAAKDVFKSLNGKEKDGVIGNKVAASLVASGATKKIVEMLLEENKAAIDKALKAKAEEEEKKAA